MYRNNLKYTFFRKNFYSIYVIVFLCLINFSYPLVMSAESQMKEFVKSAGYSDSGMSAPEPEETVAKIVEYVLSFLGVIFIVLLIYAGFLWMTASGDDEQITKAKDIMTQALIGIVIVLSAFIITTTIIGKLGEATGT